MPGTPSRLLRRGKRSRRISFDSKTSSLLVLVGCVLVGESVRPTGLTVAQIPSPVPLRLMKAPAAVHPLPMGEGQETKEHNMNASPLPRERVSDEGGRVRGQLVLIEH